jgi:hypothetical protein
MRQPARREPDPARHQHLEWQPRARDHR